MVQPPRRVPQPRNAVIAGVLLLIAVIGAFWVPIYARSAPKLGDFPFFYWFQLIWMPVVMVLCYLAYLLLRAPRTGRAPGRGPAEDREEAP
jgi:uncharacterized protein DUF3311